MVASSTYSVEYSKTLHSSIYSGYNRVFKFDASKVIYITPTVSFETEHLDDTTIDNL